MSAEFDILSPPDQTWWEFWKALRETICSTIKDLPRMAEEADGGAADAALYRHLLARLMEFGDRQYYYFYRGFGGSEEDISSSPAPCDDFTFEKLNYHRLIKDRTIHPRYVLRQTYDQLARDFTTIRHSIFVRYLGTAVEKKALQFADAYGELLLPRTDGVESGSEKPLIVSYFDLSPEIRLLPYANAVLIGIPYTSTLFTGESGEAGGGNAPLDALVMGHEIGHFYYRNGGTGRVPVRDRLLEEFVFEPFYVRNWMEELFCDVFSVLSIKDEEIICRGLYWLKDNPIEMVLKDPGAHPTDPVRLYIYQLAYQLHRPNLTRLSDCSADFEEEPTIDGPDFLHTVDEDGNPEKIKIDQVQKTIKNVVEEIIALLSAGGKETREDEGSLAAAAESREARKVSPLINRYMDLPALVRMNVSEEEQRPFEALRDNKEVHQPIPPDVWKIIFEAEGWIDGGLPGDTHATGGLEDSRSH